MSFRKEVLDAFDEVDDEIIDLQRRVMLIDDEISNNGVVRDLRKAEKQIERLTRQNADLFSLVETRFAELGTNGIATAINKLNKEVFAKYKDPELSNGWNLRESMQILTGNADKYIALEATLAGKVDAIIAHLGIDVEVKPKEVIESKVVVKKKPVTKKKGRR